MISKILLKRTLTNSDVTILVLGKGYIGNYVAEHFKDKCKVFHCSKSDLNYHDYPTLAKFIFNNGINFVINCSGFTGRPNVDEAEFKKEECWNLNVVVPMTILKACNYAGAVMLHVSSGCIYDGYSKLYTEEDTPNFGIFSDVSSFYSKSKHAFETLVKTFPIKILRVRMPICNDLTNPRNYLHKILKYPNLIDQLNSKTYIPDLCGFMETLISSDKLSYSTCDIYNVVNPYAKSTIEVINHLNRMNEGNWPIQNPTWVDIKDLKLATSRSNCVLDHTKVCELYPMASENTILNMVCNYNNGIAAV